MNILLIAKERPLASVPLFDFGELSTIARENPKSFTVVTRFAKQPEDYNYLKHGREGRRPQDGGKRGKQNFFLARGKGSELFNFIERKTVRTKRFKRKFISIESGRSYLKW